MCVCVSLCVLWLWCVLLCPTVCLLCSVTELHNLESLGLSDNRLTAVSLPSIIHNLNPLSVLNLDISFNIVHDQGAKAIANHFNYTNNVLRYLNLANCDLLCSDMKIICQVLRVYPNNLEELCLAGNKIAAEGAVGKWDMGLDFVAVGSM